MRIVLKASCSPWHKDQAQIVKGPGGAGEDGEEDGGDEEGEEGAGRGFEAAVQFEIQILFGNHDDLL